MTPPRISVLVRSMDRPTLPRALDSVAAQGRDDVEIVVVAASGATHRPLPPRDRGLAVAFIPSQVPLTRAQSANVALLAASGQLLNFLDDDDEFLPGHFGTMLAALDAQPERVLAFGQQEIVDDAHRRIGVMGLTKPPNEPFTRLALFDMACFGIHAALFRREVLARGARFDESFDICEDHDFWLQCAMLGEFAPVPRVTTRWHGFVGNSGGGWGANWDTERMQSGRARIAAKWGGERQRYLQTARGMLEHAQRSLYRADAKTSLATTEAVLRVLPDNPSALNFAALANHKLRRTERARALIAKALELAPGHPGLLANRELFSET